MDISNLKGVGKKFSIALRNLGIKTVKDLVNFYPRSYEDWSNPISIEVARERKNACIKVKIKSKAIPLKLKSGSILYKLKATDGIDELEILIFNSKYSFQRLEIGKEYELMGTVTKSFNKYQITSPKIKSDKEENIIPIYSQTKGISSKKLASLVKNAFSLVSEDKPPDILPKSLLEENELCHIAFALRNIHFPKNKECLKIARKRIIFEEFFWYHLNMKSLKKNARQKTDAVVSKDYSNEFYRLLPFEATEKQKSVIKECILDMKALSMNRLLQGDVGSGKTVVASGIAYSAVKNGFQVAFMVPTELLACQHYKTLCDLFKNSKINIELICGSMTTRNKRNVYENIELGISDIVIGTHALISENVVFKNLGLIITDEQHRFGVNQRGKLVKKGSNPHVLVMSATPIPRSLAMIIYGDMEVSVLENVLPGRQKIETYHIRTDKRQRMFGFLKDTISQGGQAYIVCASIEGSENSDILDVQKCKKMILDYGFESSLVEILHGKMNSCDKDLIMNRFISGDIKILISTTVIEVGIDVPNANLIIIENAERFGISQLHQLRGRVGRGQRKSYCILVSDSYSKDSERRFSAMTSSGDGFYLSEEDLKIRGPGDFFGVNQHGVPNIKLSTAYEDMPIVKKAEACAKRLSDDENILKSSEFSKLKSKLSKIQGENVLGESLVIF